MSISGYFLIGEETFQYEIERIRTFDGDEYENDEDIENNLLQADQVFYKAEGTDGDTYYRWLGGPYENVTDVEAAIIDEVDHYEEAGG